MTADEVGGRFHIVMLRFAFLHSHPDRRITLDLLTAVEAAALDRVRGLKAFLDGDAGQAMPLQARLAVLHGVMSAKQVGSWAIEAHRQLTEAGETAS
ncbi:MAG: hypothetical protein WDN06_05940 [Asticcacaulis sp.]